MEENETPGSHSESTSESLKGFDREGKVRAETEPGWVGNPGVQSQDPLKGMHLVDKLFRLVKTIKTASHYVRLPRKTLMSSAQVDLKGR